MFCRSSAAQKKNPRARRVINGNNVISVIEDIKENLSGWLQEEEKLHSLFSYMKGPFYHQVIYLSLVKDVCFLKSESCGWIRLGGSVWILNRQGFQKEREKAASAVVQLQPVSLFLSLSGDKANEGER